MSRSRLRSTACSARGEDRYAYVTNLLETGFTFTEDETYTWKRKDAPWPATQEEQDELWRKRIKTKCWRSLSAANWTVPLRPMPPLS